MTKVAHQEISVVTTLDVVADYALYASDYSGCILTRRTRKKPISVAENQASIVAISQLMISLEGYINRVLFLSEADVSVYDRKYCDQKLATLLSVGNSSKGLISHVNEALVVRNAIMHSHIYVSDRDPSRNIVSIEQSILDLTNKRYENAVNVKTFRTNILHLHVVPSEIGFDDVFKALKMWSQIYKQLQIRYKTDAYLPPYSARNFERFMKMGGRENDFKAIPFDNNGSFSMLLKYFQHPELYKQLAQS